MQIGSRVPGGYDSHIQENARMEQTKNAETMKQTQSSAVLSGLKEGAVFKGEILDIAGDKITIALENQSKLSARLQADIELGVGDQLLFSVKENNISQILLRPMFDSLYSAQTQVLEKALDMAGLSPTEKNFSAAKELMEAGMPVDKGSMVKILSQSMKFPDASMQTLVALNKMNIPVTEANIAQYERYQNYNHQLNGDIARTADGIAAFTDVFSDDATGSSLLSVANEILDIFTQAILEEGVEDGTAVNQESLPADSTDIGSEEGQMSGLPQDKNTAVSSGQGVEGESQQTQKNAIFLETMQITGKTGLSKEEVSNLTNALQKAEISDEQIQNIYNQTGSKEQLLKSITQALGSSGASDEAIRGILEANEFRKMLSQVIKDSWALNPKEMKDPKEIDELYNRILKQSQHLEEAIATKGGDARNFNQSFQNMRQNMQFMEQLNHQMVYAQMPLKLSNQNTNSELYVYADKRKLAAKKDGISVMLHLDMDHLGMTDIKVTLTGTNVNARFYLNDQQSVDIVADNMPQLAKQLAERGFSLTNEVIKRQPQESINKVVDEIIDENAERSIKRYTFDART